MKGELDWVLLKALEKDRTRRYETANGLAADIQRYLANEPVAARPPSTVYRLQKPWRRNKFAFVAGAAIAASLVIGIAASIWQAVRADREATRTVTALDELRATAPAFAEQARVLAAKDQFDEALEKLAYAAKLRPDVPEYLIAEGDLLQCQFRLAEAAAAYRSRARPARPATPVPRPAPNSATNCSRHRPAKRDKLSRESLSKLHLAMQQQQRPAAELMPVARLLGEEKKLVVAYWLERLKGLPISADKPLQNASPSAKTVGSRSISAGRRSPISPARRRALAVLNLAGAGALSSIARPAWDEVDRVEPRRNESRGPRPTGEDANAREAEVDFDTGIRPGPLAGLPLRTLDVTGCPVRDISPLRGAALRSSSPRDASDGPLSARRACHSRAWIWRQRRCWTSRRWPDCRWKSAFSSATG